MKLIILGPVFMGRIKTPINYKGIYRIEHPLPIKSPRNMVRIANLMFEEVLEHTNLLIPDGQYLTDIDLAMKAAEIYTKCNPDKHTYNVYEITYPFELPKLKNIFLGYDVLISIESQIVDIFRDYPKLEFLSEKSIKNKFAKYLNENVLFSDIEIAFEFYKEIKQIRKYREDEFFSILGIYE